MESAATFNPHNYPDTPLYNIQAVSAATAVPAITLRSWERRYGIPKPQRDEKGYRLYSERDIAVARWLKDRVQHGVGISHAVHMLRILESGELQPQIETFDIARLRARMLEAVRRLDEASVIKVLSEALAVVSVEDMALQLIQPVLYQVGELWADGLLSVCGEHFASNVLRSYLAQLTRLCPAPVRTDTVMVGCAPGELHDIGALMLALFLRRRGFDVVYLGASVEADSLIRDVLSTEPAVVCLSASSQDTARSLAALYDQLTGYAGVLAFGGQVFRGEAVRANTPGIYLGPDAGIAVEEIEEALRAHDAIPHRANTRHL